MAGAAPASGPLAGDAAPLTFEDLVRDRLKGSPALAPALAGLLARPDTWVRRRVERIELASLEETTSDISLDLWLPGHTQERIAVDRGRRLIVPFGLGIKGVPLSRFDLSVEGKPASLLSYGENTVLSAAVLDHLLRAQGVAIASDRLETLCGPDRSQAVDATVEAQAAIEDAGRAGRLTDWVRLFAESYVLYASLPVELTDTLAGGDKLPVNQRHLRFSNTIVRQTAEGRRANRFTDEVATTVRLTDVGFAARYHLDLGVAAELRVTEARLVDLSDVQDQRAARGRALGPVVRDVDRITLETPFEQPPPALRTPVGVVLRLRPERRLIAREAVIVSFALFGATCAAVLGLVLDAADLPSGLPALISSPVLLAAALIVRGGPDQITRTLIRRTQLRLGAQALIAVLALALLVLGLKLRWEHLNDVLAAVRIGRFGSTARPIAELIVFSGLLALSGRLTWLLYSASRSSADDR